MVWEKINIVMTPTYDTQGTNLLRQEWRVEIESYSGPTSTEEASSNVIRHSRQKLNYTSQKGVTASYISYNFPQNRCNLTNL